MTKEEEYIENFLIKMYERYPEMFDITAMIDDVLSETKGGLKVDDFIRESEKLNDT